MEKLEIMLYSILFSFSLVFLALIVIFSENFSQVIGIKSFQIRLILFIILIFLGIILLIFSLHLKNKTKNNI